MDRHYLALLEGMGEEQTEAHAFGVFGPCENLPAASPNAYLDQAVVPMLVVSEVNTFNYTRWFEEEEAEVELGEMIKFIHFQDRTHASLFQGLSQETDAHRWVMVEYLKSMVE